MPRVVKSARPASAQVPKGLEGRCPCCGTTFVTEGDEPGSYPDVLTDLVYQFQGWRFPCPAGCGYPVFVRLDSQEEEAPRLENLYLYVLYAQDVTERVEQILVELGRQFRVKIVKEFEVLQPGGPTLETLEKAVTAAKQVLAFLSPGLLERPFALEQITLALNARNLFPIKMLECSPPAIVSSIWMLDLTVQDPRQIQKEMDRMFSTLRREIEGGRHG